MPYAKEQITIYKNREPLRTNSSSEIVKFMESLTMKAGHGITISWITVETPNLKSYQRILKFAFVRGCNKHLAKDCIIDSKRLNPALYENQSNQGKDMGFPLSEKDGAFLESDKLVFLDEKKPYIFEELQPLLIPVFNKNSGLSLEMRALELKAPDIYRLLLSVQKKLIENTPENNIQYLAVSKVRDESYNNSRVIHLALITKWNSENKLSKEGMAQIVYLIARKIKNNILLI